MKNKIKILFLCTGNSCRSQMAEGWTRTLRGNYIEVYSAGIEKHGLNPNAVSVMAEVGIDISHQKSQLFCDYEGYNLDWIITVCGHANESCPVVQASTQIKHIGFDDPPKLAKKLKENGASKKEQLEPYRRVRDEIRAFVEKLPDLLN